ncbi:RNA polymerase sigma factor [Leucobacter chinensis]|uniref:RNA polymerase sigma factor n=1 Tax=Leucobacter chinensis TaxID=2851010 RepID=UPI001C229417
MRLFTNDLLNDLLRTAYFLGGTGLEGEDLLSEALLRLFRAWARGRGPEPEAIAPYVVGTMRNLRIDILRSARMKWQHVALDNDVPADASIEEHVVQVEESQRMRSLFNELSAPYQEVLMAMHVDGIKPAVLAEAWGTTSNAVSLRASRARRQLRDKLRCSLCDRYAKGEHACLASEESVNRAA